MLRLREEMVVPEDSPTLPSSETSSLLDRAFADARDGPSVDGDGDPTRLKLLDAARDQFCRMGVQRSSMEEVARRAGVSRITIYRKFATKDALVEQVVLREFRRYFERFVVEITEAETAADRVVFAFVSSLRATLDNSLIGGVIETEPALLTGPREANGRTMAMVRSFVAGQLRREQRAGTVPADLDAELTAEIMVRISSSFLTVPSEIVDLNDNTQLEHLARTYLVPMLEPRA